MDTSALDAIWKRLAATAAEALRMTEGESARFVSNPVARLVGLLPFLAGCDEAERTALAHLATWGVANRGRARAVFDHKPADDRDPLARLAPIADFAGGDRAVIDAGMRRLALCMVAGYVRDRETDLAVGAYNPVAAGIWNADALRAELGVATAGSAAVDAQLSADGAVIMVWEP